MSLLQEMEKFGLADCAFNRKLIKEGQTMQHLYESDIADDIYDILFKNTQHKTIDFCSEFPASYVDCSRAAIYLGINDGKELFKITIERV
jgi:hypothetical protein